CAPDGRGAWWSGVVLGRDGRAGQGWTPARRGVGRAGRAPPAGSLTSRAGVPARACRPAERVSAVTVARGGAWDLAGAGDVVCGSGGGVGASGRDARTGAGRDADRGRGRR